VSTICVEKVEVKSGSKSEAAKRAWITIRANRLAKQLETGVKIETEVKEKVNKAKKEKLVKETVEKADVWDKKELDELNGVELKKLAKGNGKKAEKNIKKQLKNSEMRAIEIGGIIKTVIENVNVGKIKKEDQEKASH
jgi:hypothetical protein